MQFRLFVRHVTDLARKVPARAESLVHYETSHPAITKILDHRRPPIRVTVLAIKRHESPDSQLQQLRNTFYPVKDASR